MLIMMIPKVKDPTTMENYSPNNICNVVYKLIFKTLANRNKSCLEKFISPKQSVIVPGHQILDNVLVSLRLCTS